jgi:hypothetical protein
MRGLRKAESSCVRRGRAAGAVLVRDLVPRRSREAGLSLKGTNGFLGRLALQLEVAGPRGDRSQALRRAQTVRLRVFPRRRAAEELPGVNGASRRRLESRVLCRTSVPHSV